MTEPNGRIRLSWAQIVWGIASLAAIIGGWYDIRSKLDVLTYRVERSDGEHDKMWKAIDEAKASPRPGP